MSTPDARHAFTDISIATKIGNQQVAEGVLQFIRDGFFDLSKENEQRYFIDTLTGDNDISLTLAASRLVSNTKDKHPLEELLKDRINKEITLKNIILQAPDLFIAFQIDDTAWWLTNKDLPKDPTKEMRWNFKKMDVKAHEKFYTLSKSSVTTPTGESSQKSISEILKQKQAAIMLKKAVELKKKEAAETAVKKYKEAALATKSAQEEPKK